MPAGIAFNTGTETLGAGASRINDLSATEPYGKADQRQGGIGAKMKVTWNRAGAGASAAWQSASEPFLRQAVSYHMRRSRASRRAWQSAFEKPQAVRVAEQSSTPDASAAAREKET